jgi:la-related protein 1
MAPAASADSDPLVVNDVRAPTDDFYSEEEEFIDYQPRSFTGSSHNGGFLAVNRKTQDKSKRKDRLCYRHRTGAGYRKSHVNYSREIADDLRMLDESRHSYGPELDDLKLDFNTSCDRQVRDDRSGVGSKIIRITKVKRGAFQRYGANIRAMLRSEKLSETTDQDVRHYWDHVSHELMEDGFFVESKYQLFKSNALHERESLGIGNSPEINSLYCFWCFYLRKAFDHVMYDEFLRLAREDVAAGSHYGIECFFRFASYGLETNWNEAVYDDFEEEAMRDYARKSTYGIEKLKAFHMNQKHDFPIGLKPETEAALAQFPTLESFKKKQGNGGRRDGRGWRHGRNQRPTVRGRGSR